MGLASEMANQRMNERPVLIFDLDGTISDPAVGIGNSINFALAAEGFDTVCAAAISQVIGPPLDHSFRRLTGSDSPELIERLVAKYRQRYGQTGYAENVLYPGISQVIGELSKRGHILGICTSKRADFAERILHLFNLRAHFAFLSGGDAGVEKKDQLAALLRQEAVGTDSIMIGDRAVDVLAAAANGMSSVGVLWGHGTRSELQQAGASVIFRSVAQLRSLGE